MFNSKCVQSMTIILLSVLLYSCSYWRAADRHALGQMESSPRIRIQLIDGEIIETNNYYLLSDTLVIKATSSLFYDGKERFIPPSQIEKVKVQNTNWILSAAFLIGMTWSLVMIMIFATGYGTGFPGN